MTEPDTPSAEPLDDSQDLNAQAARAAELLEALAADPSLVAGLEPPLRMRLIIAAGRVSAPSRRTRKRIARAVGQRFRKQRRDADTERLDQTGIREKRRAAIYATPPPSAPDRLLSASTEDAAPVHEPRNCYVCKTDFNDVHFFYDQMCPACAQLNWDKRQQSADLSGRTALVTGARVKIGYQAAIMLLRAGARVIVTTRFPVDAAKRYAAEDDHAQWCDRLSIYGLDLRHTPSIEVFTRALFETESRLDFVLNNACQTVRRPAGFYRHLIDGEMQQGTLPTTVTQPALPADVSPLTSALLSHDADQRLFPLGKLDADLQQIDLRRTNSWRLRLDEVDTPELFEVFLINTIAPYLLNARLKALMLRAPSRDKHIVNVSAMEGQFYRYVKTDKHPHTNMAKAALNMMTRTSATDYIKDGIHMNSVDTGWVTDEDPVDHAERKAQGGFTPPLDIVDGAARICDPIFSGTNTGEHLWGLFLKDYKPTHW